MKEKSMLQNLDIYKEHIQEINGIKTLIMKVQNKDINVLKTIADALLNEMNPGFIFFINVKENDTVHFIAKSNSFVHAGDTIKAAASLSEGKGGGSATFAQGGGKTTEHINTIVHSIKKGIQSHE